MKSWHRREDESLKAYEAFMLYLKDGYRRTQKRVAQMLGYKTTRLIEHWSAKFEWRMRIQDYMQDELTCMLESNIHRNVNFIEQLYKVYEVIPAAIAKKLTKVSLDNEPYFNLYKWLNDFTKTLPMTTEFQAKEIEKLIHKGDTDKSPDYINNGTINDVIKILEGDSAALPGDDGENAD